MRRFGFLLVLAFGLAASPRALLAQDPGDRVRVRTDARMLIGQIAGLREDKIDLALDGWQLAELEGPYYSVTRTDIRVMERSRGAAVSWGGVIAAGLLGAGHGSLASSWDDSSGPRELYPVFGAVAWGGTVAVISLLGENERWEPVRLLGTEPAFSPIVGLDVHGASAVVLGLRLRP